MPRSIFEGEKSSGKPRVQNSSRVTVTIAKHQFQQKQQGSEAKRTENKNKNRRIERQDKQGNS
jgi:hypothetical protein